MRTASPRNSGHQLMRACVLISAALMLQGCLVAAIPMVAGGALASRDVINENRDNSAPAPGPAARPATPPAEPTTADAMLAANSEPATKQPEPTQTSTPPVRGHAASSAYTSFASYALMQAALADGEAQSAVLENPGALDGARA